MTALLVVTRNPALAIGMQRHGYDVADVRPDRYGDWVGAVGDAAAVVLELSDPVAAEAAVLRLRAEGLGVPVLIVSNGAPGWTTTAAHAGPGTRVLELPIALPGLLAALGELIAAGPVDVPAPEAAPDAGAPEGAPDGAAPEPDAEPHAAAPEGAPDGAALEPEAAPDAAEPDAAPEAAPAAAPAGAAAPELPAPDGAAAAPPEGAMPDEPPDAGGPEHLLRSVAAELGLTISDAGTVVPAPGVPAGEPVAVRPDEPLTGPPPDPLTDPLDHPAAGPTATAAGPPG